MNYYLVIAGVCSLIAALLHVAIIVGGASWYRFFGAGEQMARWAEAGMVKPTLITLGIAAMLAVWSWIAFAAADLVPKLPWNNLLLGVIAVVYLARGLAGFWPVLNGLEQFMGNSGRFWLWSSLICTTFGVLHALGLYTALKR
jgi:hypothetical protein